MPLDLSRDVAIRWSDPDPNHAPLLKECGASEISVELAMGVIARLLPEEAQGNLEAARQHARRWAH